jgi:D-glycero-D-manno-heptose 1,7-bisphosphate phosphatase
MNGESYLSFLVVEPAVFLDRDNTIIDNDGDLGDPSKVSVRDGVAAGLKALREAGYRLVVVTNQGGVARGRFTENDVNSVHETIAQIVEKQAARPQLIDRFYYCPYHPEGSVTEYRREHPWRKPRAGMLFQAARDLQLDLARSWMVGDQPRDVEAGQSAGCRTVQLGANGTNGTAPPTAQVSTFSEAVQVILQSTTRDATPTARVPVREEAPPPPPAPAPSPPPTAPPEPAPAPTPADDGGLRRAVVELTDEIRSHRQRRSEFTGLKMAALIAQMLVILIALLGLLQLGNIEAFTKWMLGAVVLQLLTITMLLVDFRG